MAGTALGTMAVVYIGSSATAGTAFSEKKEGKKWAEPALRASRRYPLLLCLWAYVRRYVQYIPCYPEADVWGGAEQRLHRSDMQANKRRGGEIGSSARLAISFPSGPLLGQTSYEMSGLEHQLVGVLREDTLSPAGYHPRGEVARVAGGNRNVLMEGNWGREKLG